MHCFTETWEVASAALDLGFHISFSGIVTFKNALQIKEVAQKPRSTGYWSRPTPLSGTGPSGANSTSRPMCAMWPRKWPACAVYRSTK